MSWLIITVVEVAKRPIGRAAGRWPGEHSNWPHSFTPPKVAAIAVRFGYTARSLWAYIANGPTRIHVRTRPRGDYGAFGIVTLALTGKCAAAEDDPPFPVTIRVDAAVTQVAAKPIWRFFGADRRV
jgi:hypothetical protein